MGLRSLSRISENTSVPARGEPDVLAADKIGGVPIQVEQVTFTPT